VLLATLLLTSGGAAAGSLLSGLVLEDDTGRAWHLAELDGIPVLVTVADRTAAAEANAWGARLAEDDVALAPWRAAGKVAWLAVADLGRVPEYARDAARARVREREAGRSPGERRQSSPVLLDWQGQIAERFRADRGRALLVLLADDGHVLMQARGPVTDASLERLREALAGAVAR
jgi:hypothetical protein